MTCGDLTPEGDGEEEDMDTETKAKPDYQFPEDVKAKIDRLVELHLKIEGRAQED